MRAVACLDKIIKHNICMIAEIGVNHNGSFVNAKKMIVAAKKLGQAQLNFRTLRQKKRDEY
jgi:sialic acid synthase SpsE